MLQGCVLRHSYFIPTLLIGETAFEGLFEKIKRMQNEKCQARQIAIRDLTRLWILNRVMLPNILHAQDGLTAVPCER